MNIWTKLRRLLRRQVPVLIFAQHAEPTIWPYYGKARRVVDGDPKISQCPESRVNEILRHWQRVQRDLANHRKYVRLLEQDECLLRPYIEGVTLDAPAPGA